MPTVIDLHAIGDAPGTVESVAKSLREGSAVGLPFDWSYGLAVSPWSRRPGDAEARKDAPESWAAGRIAALAFRDVCAVNDAFGPVAADVRRLLRRCWPGPALVEFPSGSCPASFGRLSEPVRRALCRDDAVRATIPPHPFVRALLDHLPGPLVVALPGTADEPHTTASALSEACSGEFEILVDDGPVRYDQPPTTLSVEGGRWRIVEQGVLSARAIQQMAGEVILFVCTGNTCRSPMAEGLCRRRLAERLGVREDELAEQGFEVLSAGLAAMPGAPANPEAVALLARHGVDLDAHESQPLSRELLDRADRIYAMTRSHRDTILGEAPEAAEKVRLLSPAGVDLCDPIGGGPREYGDCLTRISQDLDALIDEVLGEEGKVS